MTGLYLLIGSAAALVVAYVLLARRLSSKEVATLATMAALASAGRVAFAAIPSVQPATVIVLITGFVFGPAGGFLTGATTALTSNLFIGQGPWTIPQMLAWGIVGAGGGLLGRAAPRAGTRTLVVTSALAGLAFSWAMNLWFWASYVYPHSVASLVGVFAASLWFDVLHVVGNAAFALVLSARLVRILTRFKDRFHVAWVAGDGAPEVLPGAAGTPVAGQVGADA